MKALKLVDGDACYHATRNRPGPVRRAANKRPESEVKFKLYGEEVIQKTVTASGSCGRVYLPLGWVGKKVKIIRVD